MELKQTVSSQLIANLLLASNQSLDLGTGTITSTGTSSFGEVGIGIASPDRPLEIRNASPVIRLRATGSYLNAAAGYVEFGGDNAGSWKRTGYVGDGISGDTSIYLRAEVENLKLGDSSSDSVLTLSGGDATFTGTINIGDSGKIYFRDTDISIGSTLTDGILDITADFAIDMFFDNADRGAEQDGQHLNINRRAAGDDYISLFVNKDRKGLIGFSGDDDLLVLDANALTVNGNFNATGDVQGETVTIKGSGEWEWKNDEAAGKLILQPQTSVTGRLELRPFSPTNDDKDNTWQIYGKFTGAGNAQHKITLGWDTSLDSGAGAYKLSVEWANAQDIKGMLFGMEGTSGVTSVMKFNHNTGNLFDVLFHEAGNGKVAINKASASEALDVSGNIAFDAGLLGGDSSYLGIGSRAIHGAELGISAGNVTLMLVEETLRSPTLFRAGFFNTEHQGEAISAGVQGILGSARYNPIATSTMKYTQAVRGTAFVTMGTSDVTTTENVTLGTFENGIIPFYSKITLVTSSGVDNTSFTTRRAAHFMASKATYSSTNTTNSTFIIDDVFAFLDVGQDGIGDSDVDGNLIITNNIWGLGIHTLKNFIGDTGGRLSIGKITAPTVALDVVGEAKTTSDITSGGQFKAANGSSSAPGYAFSSDAGNDTGMFRVGFNNILVFVKDGVDRLRFINGITIFNNDNADKDFRIDSMGITGLFKVDAGDNEVRMGANGATNYTAFTATGDIVQVGAGRTLESLKYKLTAIGGVAVRLTNKTGGNTAAGQLVSPYSATAVDDAFKTSTADSDEVFGIVLDTGVGDGSEAWVIISGIADVLIDAGGSARGDRMIASATAGSADVWNVGGAVATHFLEIGHCIETRGGAGLARCILHFN